MIQHPDYFVFTIACGMAWGVAMHSSPPSWFWVFLGCFTAFCLFMPYIDTKIDDLADWIKRKIDQ